MPPANSPAPAVRIALVLLLAAAALLALAWAAGNLRQVPPGSQAVVVQFGRVAGVQKSGLVMALPRPLEQVVLLPSADRQSALKVAADAAPYLTGDGGVVALDGSVTWRIADAAAYCAGRDHVAAALTRLFLSAGVTVAARRSLDDFTGLLPGHAADPTVQEARRVMGGELVAAVNTKLATLERAGASLGVEVTGAEVTALQPPSPRSGVDAVQDATRRAEQGLALARTQAAQTRAQAEQARDALLSAAHARAAERLAGARASIAVISALETRTDAAGRPGLLDQLYRDRIGPILRQAGSISAVDAKSVSRLILPGAQ